jgi:phenylalanyl-tRNA synthetase beta subunit
MKALIRLVLTVLVLGGIILFVVSRFNNTSLSPQTIDLAVDCSELDNVLVAKAVNVAVRNLSSRSHSDVSVKVVAVDEAGTVVQEKFTTFSRTLRPNSRFDKPVTVPAATKRCDCTIVSSHPAR